MTRALLKDIKFFILENYIKILMSLRICKVVETDLFTLVCLSKACFSSSMGCLDSAYSLSGRGHISMPDDLFVGNHRAIHALLQVNFQPIKIRLLLTQYGKAEGLG